MSFAGIAIATYYEPTEEELKRPHSNAMFYLSLAASSLSGISLGMGEATFLGFLKSFPSKLVGAVSSGTGFAGLSGTGILLILQSINLSNTAIFLIATPTVVIYISAF